jgi:UDP-N-acetylmuramoyl-tripeptide--D-alanyl-D-alanine ligase
MAVHRLPSGAVVIDDAYNANPTSMTAALDALVAIPARRHLAVVGLMAELDDAEAAHRTIAARAIDDGIELIAVGTDLYGVAPCADPIAAVGPLGQGTAVLVKASRVAGLDRIAAQLAAASPAVEPGGDEPLP